MKDGACQFATALGLFLAVSLCGCSVDYYRAETRLNSDGSVERAIYQPAKATPEEAQDAGLWEQTTAAAKLKPEAWSGPISKLAPAEADDDHPYFAAWGRFESADKIPEHFVKPSPDKSRQARLVRKTERNDLVFVTEHRWRETLTDVVTLDDMHLACHELADLYIGHVDDVLSQGLGPDYDHARLIAWLKGEGATWFVELADVFFEAGARGQLQQGDEPLKEPVARVCARHGLKNLENGAVAEFAAARLRELIRRKDGKPVDEKTIESILIWLSIKHVEDANGEPRKSPLEDVAKQIIERKYGSKEAFQLKTSTLASRIWGVHGPFTTPQRFDYSLEMPGTIVETTGKLLAEDRVRWSFDAGAAYPFGYDMTCRSLEPNEKVLKKLLDRQPLDSRTALLSFAEIVSGNDGLIAALKQCVALDSISPLENYRVQTETENEPGDEPVLDIKRLWKLLKLPQ